MTPYTFAGNLIEPGTRQTIELQVSVLANNMPMKLPVHVIHGREAGPVFFISGAVHGDEIQGAEVVRRVIKHLSPDTMRGTVLAVPIVNSFGFLNHSRYMPDRRDLNRSFPGSDQGSLASLLADLFFREVVARSTYGIDLHTAALHRTNLPQIRIAPGDKQLDAMAEAFAPPVILVSKLREGSLRLSAKDAGVKVLLYEGGEALRFDEASITAGVQGTLRVMRHVGLIADAPAIAPHSKSVHSAASMWVRAPEGGILHSVRQVGDRVGKLEPIGVISDPLGEETVSVVAEDDGIIIGKTNLPLVNRGDALFHIARLSLTTRGSAQVTPDEDEII
jgi:predicted deacylase